ncbi:histidine kinase [Rhodococcus sp. FH8]|jgi:signal transduction histidine kinase|uniref:sensor histidine kinase n=1 Tax=Rhodococcus TaxID=1827 RepID=UPI0005A83DB8|nr:MULTISPECIES: ATP-binding protein [Rhodococcus]MBW0282603.1 histidine kinase [Rhodococcus sp. FH8]MBW4816501.1 ATP-binding protein [Rhodococcus qingshengii]MCD2135664.1 ATP-binding protein [Rhodococcus qingshengii]
MTHQSLRPEQKAVRTEDTDRILRMFARFTSIGYIAYLVILSPSITELAPRMAPWWTPIMVVAVFGSGLIPGALSFRTETQAMRAAAALAATVFLIAVATWPAAWNGPDLPANDGVWLAAFPGLASLAAVLVWSTPAAFVHLAIGCTGVQLINLVARDGAQSGMLVPEIAFAIMFCTLFVGGAAMALRTGRVLDATTDETYAAAADAAAQRARIVERERFDALIHDSVLSTLLAASHGQPHSLLRDLSETTLAELDDLRIGSEPAQPFSLEHALVHLRTAATDADAQARFEVIDTDTEPLPFLPAECVRALGSALSEALRNSRLHAGPDALRTVTTAVTRTGVRIEVADNGSGFVASDVAPHRLGITVSILGRMRAVPGGSAHVDTSPGVGTTVHLGWESE